MARRTNETRPAVARRAAQPSTRWWTGSQTCGSACSWPCALAQTAMHTWEWIRPRDSTALRGSRPVRSGTSVQTVSKFRDRESSSPQWNQTCCVQWVKANNVLLGFQRLPRVDRLTILPIHKDRAFVACFANNGGHHRHTIAFLNQQIRMFFENHAWNTENEKHTKQTKATAITVNGRFGVVECGVLSQQQFVGGFRTKTFQSGITATVDIGAHSCKLLWTVRQLLNFWRDKKRVGKQSTDQPNCLYLQTQLGFEWWLWKTSPCLVCATNAKQPNWHRPIRPQWSLGFYRRQTTQCFVEPIATRWFGQWNRNSIVFVLQAMLFRQENRTNRD